MWLLLLACRGPGPDPDSASSCAWEGAVDARPLVEGVQLQVLAPSGADQGVLVLGGGFDPAQVPAQELFQADRALAQLHVELPGAQQPEDKDHFGPASLEAAQTALRYAAGEALDEGRCSLPERLPELNPELLVAGISNGGNLAVQLLADEATPSVRGLTTWETPLGAQAILQELVLPETGACAWSPHFGCEQELEQLAWRGLPWIDRDGDGEIDEDEPTFKGLVLDEGRLHSPQLLEVLGPQEQTMSLAASQDWFAHRDAGQSGRVAEVVAQHPELEVIVLGSELDHVQELPDSPHVLALGGAFHEAGAWTRLNPDGAYTGEADNAPGEGFDPRDPGALVSEDLSREELVGAALEELRARLSED